MFTQLSLFDSSASLNTVPGGAAVPSAAEFVHVSLAEQRAAKRTSAAVKPAAPSAKRSQSAPAPATSATRDGGAASDRCTDAIRPMGELAQLVLARYDLVARRRQERERLRREQPRKSIRVLSPPMLAAT